MQLHLLKTLHSDPMHKPDSIRKPKPKPEHEPEPKPDPNHDPTLTFAESYHRGKVRKCEACKSRR